jgi:hypothetical protein
VDDIVVKPYHPDKPPRANKREYNMFYGLAARKVPVVDMALIQPLLDHFKYIWCAGDEDLFQYLMHVLAFPLQNIKRPMSQVAVILTGEPGCGKSKVIDIFTKYIYGTQLSYIGNAGLKRVTGQFNLEIAGKMFMTVNELSSMHGRDFHSMFDKLKSFITDDTINIEAKNVDSDTMENVMNFVLPTNHKFAAKVEKGDRRWLVLQCSNARVGDGDYHNGILKSLNQVVGNHLYTYLRNMKVTIDIRMVPIPMTDAKEHMMEASRDPVDVFLAILQKGDADEEGDIGYITAYRKAAKKGEEKGLLVVKCVDAYASYKVWMKQNYSTRKEASGPRFRTAFVGVYGKGDGHSIPKLKKTVRGVELPADCPHVHVDGEQSPYKT